MISNQILQNTIEGLKGISKVDFCVLDTEGKELAATGEVDKNCSDAVLAFVESPADSQVIQGRQFFKIFDEQRLEYVLVANGDSEGEYMLGKIAASRSRVFWLHIKRDLTRIILSKTCFWITFCWWIFIIVPKNYILTRK